MMAMMMSVLGVQIYRHWGNWRAIGLAFVLLLTITTVVAGILGVAFRERAWCMICPMGSMSSLVSGGKLPLQISEVCDGCEACSKVCPMDIKPFTYRGKNLVADNDCIKCGSCEAICHMGAIK